MSRPNGYIIHETKTRVVILTMQSDNIKTGNMAQLWILARNIAPTAAAKTGNDSIVCGDCKHRPANNGTCYVTLFQGPLSIWNCYQRGNYPFLPASDYPVILAGRKIRLGAYGDPAYVPLDIIARLTSAAAGFTGYTHQWRRCNPRLSQFTMASVDSITEYQDAKLAGWRTFRVSSAAAGSDNIAGKEITCPATAGRHCIDCLLCSGNRLRARDITIQVHGSKASKFKA
jgi:hypothetical protein